MKREDSRSLLFSAVFNKCNHLTHVTVHAVARGRVFGSFPVRISKLKLVVEISVFVFRNRVRIVNN